VPIVNAKTNLKFIVGSIQAEILSFSKNTLISFLYKLLYAYQIADAKLNYPYESPVYSQSYNRWDEISIFLLWSIYPVILNATVEIVADFS
jgi:hypothetical protein